MNIDIDKDSEVWKDYGGKTLGDLQGAALALGEVLCKRDPERAYELQDIKNAIAITAMDVAREESDNALESMFLLCCIAADVAITSLAAIDRYRFECFLRDM